ncbi:MAG TPA: hypothetical protein VJC11_01710, partial [Patescibacteria group bacterium]|nr:hypothetical protein [Patescibacteria group bacterium]
MSPEDKKQKDVEKLSPLKDIYHSDLGEENKQYFSTLERGKIMERWKKLLIGFFVVLILLASATVAGFIIFQSKEKFTGEHIRLGFSGPESVSSGDSFSVTVTYENNETVALKNAEFTASFPEGYTLEQAVPAPANEFKNTWPLKDIGVGQKGSIIIRGRLVGQDSGAKTISGKLNFEPANFSSPFDVRASYTVRIQESALKLTLDFAPRASAAAEVSGTISLRNESDETLRDIRLEVIFPTDFTIASTEPKATEGARWDIDALSKDKPYQIAVKGTFHGSNGDLKELRAKASIRSDKNEFVTQADTNALISIIDTNLQASLTVNGRSGNFSVDWGETLDIVLKVRNAGDQIIRDAVGSLAVDSTIIDWDKIRWTTPGKRDKTKIIWTKTEFSDLAEIAPNAETTLAVSVPIIERPPQSVSSTDLMIRITGDIVSTNVV